jgi:hypothetical protein
MDDIPVVNEAGTVVIFDTVLRKAIEYSSLLDADSEQREKWQELVDGMVFFEANGRYLAHRRAPDGARTSPWFSNGLYLGEAQEYLDIEMFRRTVDSEPPLTHCNWAWLNSAAASSQLRLGRPDRAEQHLVDTLEHRIHGPGYFEEMAPSGVAALPPFATAHGSFVTAMCEQIVLSDFWRPAIAVGVGLPTRLRSRRIAFHGMRAIRGVIVSGTLEPRRAAAKFTPTGGTPGDVDITLAIPACVGSMFDVHIDGRPADYTFAGESVTVRVTLTNRPVDVVVEG